MQLIYAAICLVSTRKSASARSWFPRQRKLEFAVSNNDWHYKQVQYELANTKLKAKATYVRSKPCCCVVTNPFAGKVPSSLQIRDLERTSCTLNAVRWFLFGSYVPTASTLEEKLLTQNPSTIVHSKNTEPWDVFDFFQMFWKIFQFLFSSVLKLLLSF